MSRPIGKLFREVVIDAELKQAVNEILRASSGVALDALAAKRRIRQMATADKAYLFASEIRGYLEEKTRVGTEAWVFPVAGDLFLDALEANLATVGPNFFRDHYSGMMGCYDQGDESTKAVEGALYTVDLALEKTAILLLNRDASGASGSGSVLSFENRSDEGHENSPDRFLDIARCCLDESVETMTGLSKSAMSSKFLDFFVMRKEQLEKILRRWTQFLREPETQTLSNEECLERVLELSEETDYPPLTAAVKELFVSIREEHLGKEDQRRQLEESIHPLYDTGCLFLAQANRERNAGARDICLRRYGRARAVFLRIHDRTSAARVLMEEARAFMRKGGEPEAVRDTLYEGVCLVLAHIENLPYGRLPHPSDEVAIDFLHRKGYRAEAEAYAEATAHLCGRA